MAVRFSQKRDLSAIQMIARCDDSVEEKGTDWEAYFKTADEKHLVIKPNMIPTRFHLNFNFDGKGAEQIKNAMIGGSDDDGVKLAYGTWTFRVAKLALKEITNPPDLPLEEHLRMQQDARQLAHDDLLAKLDRLGVVQDIFSLYQALVLNTEKPQAKN